jgi:hypothetical protein
MNSPEPQFIYVTTTGWKTGNPHEIEIWFVQHEACCYIVSEMRERAHWVQNIRRHPAITFRLDEKSYRGTGRVIDPTVEPELAQAVSDLMDAKYNWSNGLIVELCPADEDAN